MGETKMSRSIQDIEGIGPKYAQLLNQAGIKTTGKLLETGGNRAGRRLLAEKTSINEKNILKWVNMADLFRVKGVAGQFAELLEGAGVDTVKELRNRNADNLAEKMAEVNKKKHLCKATPSSKMVTNWVGQAKKMAPMVTY
jgi:predicted flap endonuclease-1-like 5' DNA nuclease